MSAVGRALLAQPSTAARVGGLSAFGQAKAWNLMASRLPCTGCHRFNGAGGRVGPDLTDVATRRSAEYIAAIVDDPQRVVPGTSMPHTMMTPALRALVVAALARTSPEHVPPAGSAPRRSASDSLADGAKLYSQYCAACHGAGGGGDGFNASALPVRPAEHRDARAMSTRTDDRLFDAIYGGGYPLGRSAAMPGFGATLTRGEIWALVRHLRSLCRCRPPSWSTDGAPTRGVP